MNNKAREYLTAARKAAGFETAYDAGLEYGARREYISRHESGAAELKPEDALHYADIYDAPTILIDYCRSECPIGCRTMRPADASKGIAQLSTQIGNRLRKIADAAARLAEIADDNIVDADERRDFDDIVSLMSGIETIAVDLQRYAMATKRKAASPCAGRTARHASDKDAGSVYPHYTCAAAVRQ